MKISARVIITSTFGETEEHLFETGKTVESAYTKMFSEYGEVKRIVPETNRISIHFKKHLVQISGCPYVVIHESETE